MNSRPRYFNWVRLPDARTEIFQTDPHWRDLILFYEYFHGDNGAGLGASHQTGWTGLVAPLMDLFQRTDARSIADRGVKRGVGQSRGQRQGG